MSKSERSICSWDTKLRAQRPHLYRCVKVPVVRRRKMVVDVAAWSPAHLQQVMTCSQHVLIHIWEMMNCFKGDIVMGLQQYCSGGSLVFRVIKLMHHWLKSGVKSILLTEFSKTELAPVLPLIMFLKWIFSHIMMLFCGAIILFCVFWY